MRILHLIKHCKRSNGHVHVAVDLAWAHARQGHAVAVASAGGDYVGFLASHGIIHHALQYGRSPLSLVRAFGSLLALCVRSRPDVIHAHMMSSALLGFAVSRLLRIPLVTTMHNSFDHHSGLMRLGDAVVAVSEAERDLLLSRHYPAHKVVTIRNGMIGSPREHLGSDEVAPTFRTPCVVTVCGLHARKGVHHLIDAFASVAAAHPGWHLNIVGRGPDEAKLKTQVDGLKLGERVHFVGGVVNPKPLLQQSDVFALASLAEPSALVLVEARAAGCAMVASEVGGTVEALAGGMAGQLVPAADVRALADALDRLMADPELRAAWQRRARTGLECFTLERTAEKYLALYKSLSGATATPVVRQRPI